MAKRLVSGAVLLCLVSVVGCFGSGKKQVPTVRVEGKLFVDDKPYGPATISLNTKNKEIPGASGVSKADGSFELTTYKPRDGAAEGEFNVELLMDPMAGTTVPSVAPEVVTIKKPASGALKLEVKLKSTGKDPAKLDDGSKPPPT